MAEKKRTSNKKTASSAAKSSKSGKNIKGKKTGTETAAMRAVAEAEQGGGWISSRAICAIIVLVLFVLFTVILG